MTTLHTLTNETRPSQTRKCLGRGPGSGLGKTCGRGHKGAGARSGYKRRFGKEGGQFPLYMKLPTRGFNNKRFKLDYDVINLGQINQLIEAGVLAKNHIVDKNALRSIGLFNSSNKPLKVLGDGELKHAVQIFADAATHTAKEKLQKAKATIRLTLDE